MADVNYTINGQVAKGALSQSFAASGVTADMNTTGMIALTLNLGTATQAISTASLSSVGIAFARSLATTGTHTVSFGRLDGTTLYEAVTLRAGEAAVMRLAAGDYGAKAVVANSRLVISIYEG
ncbi:MAG: hypothetical protein EBR82_34650 [Caulobacteraceae bacterium]|nr:hypothetical protein [Caulobacteraceae bacterium]